MAETNGYTDYETSSDPSTTSLVSTIKSTLLTPVHALTSKTARRAYITSFLLFSASLILLAVSVLGYIAFYYAYVPTRGFTRPVYLQFDAHAARSTADMAYAHPWGVVGVQGLVASRQRYDVSVLLRMPRTERNIHAGNFMLDLTVYAPGAGGSAGAVTSATAAMGGAKGAAASVTGVVGTGQVVGAEVLAKSTRPAILTYRSFVVDMVHRAMRLPLYVFGWTAEEEIVKVGMLEGIWFDKGWRNLPSMVKVELKSREWVQVYGCWVRFDARLSGLRYFMHYHRITAFLTFTALFWGVEMGFALLSWAILSFLFFPSSQSDALSNMDDASVRPKSERASAEPSDIDTAASLSDTSRTFPTLSGLRPLHYSSSSSTKVKKEEDAEPLNLANVPMAPGETADVEDEDEDADFVLDERVGIDSGLGTSMESAVERDRRQGFRRRRSAGGGRGRD